MKQKFFVDIDKKLTDSFVVEAESKDELLAKIFECYEKMTGQNSVVYNFAITDENGETIKERDRSDYHYTDFEDPFLERQYAVKLVAPIHMTEMDYAKGIMLTDKRGWAIWFDSLDEAKTACVKAGGYCVIDSEELEDVWFNPNYRK